MFALLFLLNSNMVFAQSPIDSQINQLKERIASRVAELKLVERRGLIGTVVSVSDTQITLSDRNQNTRFVDVDELTKFNPNDSSRKNFGISDIKKGDFLGILGIYNKQSQRLLARFVDEITIQHKIYGTISSLDSKNFTAGISADDKSFTTLNFDTKTRTFSYTKDKGFKKSGFSKIETGNFFIAIGDSDTNAKSTFNAARVFVLPEITSK